MQMQWQSHAENHFVLGHCPCLNWSGRDTHHVCMDPKKVANARALELQIGCRDVTFHLKFALTVFAFAFSFDYFDNIWLTQTLLLISDIFLTAVCVLPIPIPLQVCSCGTDQDFTIVPGKQTVSVTINGALLLPLTCSIPPNGELYYQAYLTIILLSCVVQILVK